MRSRGKALPAVLGALAVLAPGIAHACAVCFGGEDTVWTDAFVLGTILMMALPPAIVVTGAVVVYRATKRQEARLKAAEEAAATRS